MPDLTKHCTGCSACVQICPSKALRMERDAEGFLFPAVDKERCTECGLCSRICPVEHPSYANTAEPRCLAAMASDELRKESSSGAVFPVLAEAVLEKGGAVCGAAFRADWSVGHIIVESKKDLEKLKGSKYVQSDMGDCFTQVKVLLEAGRQVLFTGTPCQVAGLNAYLRKDYGNLQTVDIICHGVPSPGVWEQYLEENFDTSSIARISFRNKEKGWNGESVALAMDNASGHRIHYQSFSQGTFCRGLSQNFILRRSCGECRFNRLPRQGDLTIGDFWGVRKVKKAWDDRRGTSIVLENNAKGHTMLEAVSDRFKLLVSTPLKKGIDGNPNIVRPTVPSKDRDLFFKLYASKGASAALRFFSEDESDCKIVNFWFGANYGANLTCYALQEALIDMGYAAKVINYVSLYRRMQWMGTFAEEFARRYLHLTKPLDNYSDLADLNSNTEAFLVGSDQVFRYEYYAGAGGPLYLLDFVDPAKKRIAASASFGTLEFEAPKLEKDIFTYNLKQFSAVSVREQTGVDIFSRMGIDATQVIEPVFWLPAQRYHVMADKNKAAQSSGLLYFSLSHKNASRSPYVGEFLSKALGKPLNSQKFSKHRSVEEWLDSLRGSDFVITDSFHGTCFAILFHRPFVALSTYGEMSSRMEFLLGLLGLSGRIVRPDQKEGLEALLDPIDWDTVDAIIARERERALKWLREALEASVPEVDEKQRELNLLFQKSTAREEDLKKNLALLANRWRLRYKCFVAAVLSKISPKTERRQQKECYRYYKSLLKKIRRIGQV